MKQKAVIVPCPQISDRRQPACKSPLPVQPVIYRKRVVLGGKQMKSRIEFVFLLAAIVLLGTAGLCSAQTRQMGGVGITVFADRNFRGTARTFHNDVPNLRSFGLDNRIRSLRIGAGEKWEVCAAPNYSGGCVVVSGEE